jgi:polyphosphate kinase 2 (PPK2 family)
MSLLHKVDLSLKLDRTEYSSRMLDSQLQARTLARRLYDEKRLLIAVFEGWDGAGKGGAIRRFTEKLDPRGYQVYPIAAPKGDDKTHHYLWRFWRRLLPPQERQILLFDRSWYGRVLVERVEGFAREEQWRRAYQEINNFERQLIDSGAVLAKFWFHVSPEEQLRRFEARRETPYKRWKLTDEDWRNRERWSDYESAVEDMLVKTSTLKAPWTIVEGNDKCWARVKVMETLVERMKMI